MCIQHAPRGRGGPVHAKCPEQANRGGRVWANACQHRGGDEGWLLMGSGTTQDDESPQPGGGDGCTMNTMKALDVTQVDFDTTEG